MKHSMYSDVKPILMCAVFMAGISGWMGWQHAAHAQDATTLVRNDLGGVDWHSLTPEQRAAYRAQQRTDLQDLTPTERAARRADARNNDGRLLTDAERTERSSSSRSTTTTGYTDGVYDARLNKDGETYSQAQTVNTTDNWRTQRLLPSEERTNRGHLRRGYGISRPAGVDSAITGR